MFVGPLVLVSLSLGLSNFAAATGIGLSGVDARTRMTTGLAYGFFEAVMPVVGLLLGQSLVSRIGDTGRYVGSALLIVISIYSLWQIRREGQKRDGRVDRPEGLVRRTGPSRVVVTAFALSIDNLVVGFGLSFLHVPILVTGLVIAAVSVLMSLVGLELGARLGARVGRWGETIGAVVLMFVGIAIGTRLLG